MNSVAQRCVQSLLCLGLLASVSAHAHEFWFAPVQSPQAQHATVSATVSLRLEVGESFVGDAAGFSQRQCAKMQLHTFRAQTDLKPFLSADTTEPEVLLAIGNGGTHLVTFDSEPLHITLAADKFHAYLHDEGLDFVKTQRETAGTADQPARERYYRNVKTIIQSGSVTRRGQPSDLTYAKRTGQRLEILPMSNPTSLGKGGTLGIKVEFDAKSLGGALVKAWHRHGQQLLIVRTRTSASGHAELTLPYAGGWMVSVVHMVPATDDAGVDWDSYWGNLSFSLPAASKLASKPVAKGVDKPNRNNPQTRWVVEPLRHRHAI